MEPQCIGENEKKTNYAVYALVRWMRIRHMCRLNFDMKEWMNARCLLMRTTQPSHLIICHGLRRLRLRPMTCTKLASRRYLHLKIHNNILPQGRSSQAVPLRTRPGPPSVAWRVSRQPKSVKTFARVGGDTWESKWHLGPRNKKNLDNLPPWGR